MEDSRGNEQLSKEWKVDLHLNILKISPILHKTEKEAKKLKSSQKEICMFGTYNKMISGDLCFITDFIFLALFKKVWKLFCVSARKRAWGWFIDQRNGG